jgi:hypothetical protein
MREGPTTIDLDDVIQCPIADHCEHCDRLDRDTGGLAVHTLETPVGVYCATLCPSCGDPDDLTPAKPRRPGWNRPPMSWSQAVIRVGEHCNHLGITVDQMGDALKAEED